MPIRETYHQLFENGWKDSEKKKMFVLEVNTRKAGNADEKEDFLRRSLSFHNSLIKEEFGNI